MIFRTLVVLSFLCSTACFHADWMQDEWRHLEPEVQSHLQSVVSDRLARLHGDLDGHCHRGQKVFMKLFIVNETSIAYYNKRKLWDREENSCTVTVFEAADGVLRAWCHARPDRMLMFPFSHSKVGAYEALVQTNCLHFPAGEDYPRLLLPSPFDFRQDHALQLLLFILLTLLLLLSLAFFYFHRLPIYRFLHGIWVVYRDRRDWNTINEIVKFREQRIKEEQERQREFVQTTVL